MGDLFSLSLSSSPMRECCLLVSAEIVLEEFTLPFSQNRVKHNSRNMSLGIRGREHFFFSLCIKDGERDISMLKFLRLIVLSNALFQVL